ncbi:hypothetical protein ABW21_db0204719 [Orbilia brochopaga]|nr:hypothetical protein ABW21_db0204719 [Drechslerella brochopaga]
MTEIDFAKSILLTLSSRPCTISPDHVEDPRKLPARSLSIKAIISEKTTIPTDKLRLMIKGKILGDAKTLSEIVEDGGEVTVSVMVLGGYTPSTAASTADAAAVAEKVEKAETAEDVVKMEVDSDVGDVVKVLEGEPFWQDLEVYLRQKLGTEAAAREVAAVFRKGWGSR